MGVKGKGLPKASSKNGMGGRTKSGTKRGVKKSIRMSGARKG